jgi:hypothetical protein
MLVFCTFAYTLKYSETRMKKLCRPQNSPNFLNCKTIQGNIHSWTQVLHSVKIPGVRCDDIGHTADLIKVVLPKH